MRIVQISDLHWRGISRHKEYTKAFEQLYKDLEKVKPDIIVNTGDTFHTKTTGITPEIIERLSWMFRSLADIAPTYSILGNHDGNLTNLYRKDIITPIHESINHPRAHLLRKSGVYKVKEITDKEVYLCAFSPFDKKTWPKVLPVENAINIALYHGAVNGSKMDNEWTLPLENCEARVKDFSKFDFAMLGDIHKQQFLSYRKDHAGEEKPWIGYPGSLIQQNFGEGETKGYLTWDIRSKEDWDVQFHKLENFSPFLTVGWEGSVENTIEKIAEARAEKAFLPGSRFRVSSSYAIPNVQSRKLVHTLKEAHKASEVTFKYDLVSNMDHIESNNLKISKKGLRQDPDAIVKLYLEYIKAHASNYNFKKEHLDEAEAVIRKYSARAAMDENETVTGDRKWSIKSMEFDNLFRYGEGNKINFDNLNGIVGIFGNNRTGKSSIIGSLMFTLFNTTDRGPRKNGHIINVNKNYGKGKIRFTIDGEDYLVERQSQRVGAKRNKEKAFTDKTTTTLNFWKIVYDEVRGCEKKISMNSISRDDTDKEIRKIIGTANDFLLTAFSSQGSVDSFIKEGPTERKKILSRFLELDIFEKLYYLCKEDHSELNTKGKSLSPESLISQISRTKKNISTHEKDLEVISSRIKKHRLQKDEYKLWLMHHEKNAADVDLAHINNAESSLKALNEKLEIKKAELDESRQKVSDTNKELKKTSNAKAKIDIESLKEELEKFEVLKATMNDLKHELSSQQNILSNQEKNIKKLELVPCGDEFPECHYIKDAHKDKKLFEKQKNLVALLNEKYAENENVFEKYISKNIKETIQKYNDLERQEFVLKSNLESLRSGRNNVRSQITNIKNEIKKTKKELGKLQRTVNILEGKEFEKKKESLAKVRNTIQELEASKQEILVALGGLREKFKRLVDEEEETKNLLEKLKIYDSILAAFSKTGIPAMVLKSQLPAINQELTKILDGVVNFEISLSTDVTSNNMDVHIQDGHSSRIIELASGMEKTIASLALRVALINLSSLPKSDILILDEGFGALDEENMESCMEILSFLRGYFKTIIIISHIAAVKEVADKIIEIKNTGEESSVMV